MTISIVEEIEEVAGMGTIPPDTAQFKQKKFVSGHDDCIGTEGQIKTAKLQACAKAGCPGAKHTLITEHGVKYLMLDGEVIIEEVADEIYQRPLH